MRATLSKIQIGKQGEDCAYAYFLKLGYRILSRNVRLKFGEADLVVVNAHNVVIVEVKRRDTDTFGTPEEAITKQKKQKLRMIAQYFEKQFPNKQVRIDVVGIRNDRIISHLQNLEIS